MKIIRNENFKKIRKVKVDREFVVISTYDNYPCGCYDYSEDFFFFSEVKDELKKKKIIRRCYYDAEVVEGCGICDLCHNKLICSCTEQVSKRIEDITIEEECFQEDSSCDCTSSEELEPVDNLFHGMILSHGLATGFSGQVDAEEIEKRIKYVLNTKDEICCSHKSQRVGGIGLYVKGYNSVVSNIDLYSKVGTDGVRRFDRRSWRAEGIITDRNDYSLDKWDHTEHFVYPEKIVGVWIKDWMLNQPGMDDLAEMLKTVCEELHMVFHIVKNRRKS